MYGVHIKNLLDYTPFQKKHAVKRLAKFSDRNAKINSACAVLREKTSLALGKRNK